jgi:hypothetical protein
MVTDEGGTVITEIRPMSAMTTTSSVTVKPACDTQRACLIRHPDLDSWLPSLYCREPSSPATARNREA